MAVLWKFKAFGKIYADSPEAVEADLDLPHAGNITEGDALVRVDAAGAVTAVSRVEGHSDRDSTRPRARCGVCRATNVDVRDDGSGYCRGREHRLVRTNRQLEATEVLSEIIDVTRRTFSLSTLDVTPPLTTGIPEEVVANAAKQQSIRPLVGTADAWLWARIPEVRPLLEAPPELELSLDANSSWADAVDIEGGRTDSVVRRRRNQPAFRKALLRRFGASCAVLGPMPESLLDAAHIVPFAQAEAHVLTSGLLLTTDLHRLFDRGLLALTSAPDHDILSSELAPALRTHPRYAALHGMPISLGVDDYPDLDALLDHERWARRRAAWQDEAPMDT